MFIYVLLKSTLFIQTPEINLGFLPIYFVLSFVVVAVVVEVKEKKKKITLHSFIKKK